MIEELASLFERDLIRLEKEIAEYQTDSNIWKIEGQISNSAGNLSLHLVGNLRHFVGHVLGASGYQRERDLEFSLKNIPTAELISLIHDCRSEIQAAFSTLDKEKLRSEYPIKVMNQTWSTNKFLLHLLGHLNYHLGQINYHRRLVDLN